MRIALLAACCPFAFLAACGGPQTSQANNGQADALLSERGLAARPRDQCMVMLAAAPSKDTGARHHARASRRHGNYRQDQ